MIVRLRRNNLLLIVAHRYLATSKSSQVKLMKLGPSVKDVGSMVHEQLHKLQNERTPNPTELVQERYVLYSSFRLV